MLNQNEKHANGGFSINFDFDQSKQTQKSKAAQLNKKQEFSEDLNDYGVNKVASASTKYSNLPKLLDNSVNEKKVKQLAIDVDFNIAVKQEE